MAARVKQKAGDKAAEAAQNLQAGAGAAGAAAADVGAGAAPPVQAQAQAQAQEQVHAEAHAPMPHVLADLANAAADEEAELLEQADALFEEDVLTQNRRKSELREAMRTINSLPQFDGSEATDVRTWLRLARSMWDLVDRVPFPAIRDLLAMRFTGNAMRSWQLIKPQDLPTDMERFEALLIRKFELVISEERAMGDVLDLHMRGQNIEHFNRKFQEAVGKLSVEHFDGYLMEIYRRAVDPRISEALIKSNPKSLAEAMIQSHQQWKLQQRINLEGKRKDDQDNRNSKPSFPKQQGKSDHNKRAKYNGGSTEKVKRDLSQITCYNCHKTGHYASDCAQPKSGVAKSNS